MSSRVRFSQDHPGVAYVPPNPTSTLVADILSKPKPPKHSEHDYYLDACTAASIGDEARLREMMRINPNIVIMRNISGWTPLLYASYLGHYTVVSFLLDHGARVDDSNGKGQTSLMLAAACGNTEVMNSLIEHGAQVKIMDNENRQAIHYAAMCTHHHLVETLVAAGSEVNAIDIHGMTPLLEAAAAGHEQTFSTVLAAGGDIYQKNISGDGVLTLARDQSKIIQIVEEHEKKTSQSPKNLLELLENMELQRFHKQFSDQRIDLVVFFQLKENDFKEMNVPYGPRKRMMDVIKRYHKTNTIQLEPFDTEEVTEQRSIPTSSTSSNDSVLINTMKSIKDLNINSKKHALSAFVALGAGEQSITKEALMNIINDIDAIQVQLSKHV